MKDKYVLTSTGGDAWLYFPEPDLEKNARIREFCAGISRRREGEDQTQNVRHMGSDMDHSERSPQRRLHSNYP